jgi:hypothetical protein
VSDSAWDGISIQVEPDPAPAASVVVLTVRGPTASHLPVISRLARLEREVSGGWEDIYTLVCVAGDEIAIAGAPSGEQLFVTAVGLMSPVSILLPDVGRGRYRLRIRGALGSGVTDDLAAEFTIQ